MMIVLAHTAPQLWTEQDVLIVMEMAIQTQMAFGWFRMVPTHFHQNPHNGLTKILTVMVTTA
jgi:hypothetical protein